ncbi:uncharacterized protein LOC142168944 [Nicotiana tabacum]|uniref:Uncharacterized protein LOC142168944 n=1 Tax=Nicotiana tabacum TaxID=4097 RepID=A0AC58SMN7_TOBAC
MYTRYGGGGQNHRLKRNFNVHVQFYEYCKMKGHTKENCYKLVGYPQDCLEKTKGYNAAHNANVLAENNSNSVAPMFNYGGASAPTANIDSTANATSTDTTLLVSNGSQEWIIDIGATNHMVSDSNLLNKSIIVQTSNPKKVLLPNGDDLFIGKVREIGKKERELYILLAQFARNSNRVVCAANELTASEANKINVELWHQRFGHVSILVLKRILPVSLQSIKDKVDKYLWDPYRVTTFDGNKYFLTIVDDYSRMTWVFLLKQKSDVFLCLQHFFRFVKTQFNKTIKVIKTDNGTELPSSVIENLSPYEMLHNRKPSLKHLRVLGYICFAKTIQEQDMLMPRSKKSIHMGYLEVHKGYILYDLDNKLFFINRDVIFREDIFPFKETLPSVTHLFVDTIPSISSYIDDTNIVFETSAGQQTNNHINVGNSEAPTITQTSPVDNIEEHHDIQQDNAFIDHQVSIEGEIQFKQSQYEHPLYIKRTTEGDNLKLIQDTKNSLQNIFKMKDLGELRYFLGLEFSRSDDGIVMHQRKYALELIAKVGLTTSKLAAILIDTNVNLTTKQYDEHICKNEKSEADPTVDQATYQRSSIEAVYRSLAAIVAELTWLLGMLKEIDAEVNLLVDIFTDSKAAIQIAANHVYYERTKHIEIDCYFVRDKIQQGLHY